MKKCCNLYLDKTHDSRPALGPQVVVQSKQEKSLAKKIMKLQKKKNSRFESSVTSERDEYEQM